MITSGAHGHSCRNQRVIEFLAEVQAFVDGALYQDATPMRCDLNHTTDLLLKESTRVYPVLVH
jgi:hypothetical protein